MGLDSYSKRNLEQVQNDTQVLDELHKMQIDPDLKEMLRKVEMDSEMEQEMLERQNGYNSTALNSSQTKSLDSMQVSEMNFSSTNNTQNIQQEEDLANLSNKYSEEEKQPVQPALQDYIKYREEILALLDAKINEHDNSDFEEEYSPRHR